MDCERIARDELIEKYLRARLEPALERELQVHLLECRECLTLIETCQEAREELAERASIVEQTPAERRSGRSLRKWFTLGHASAVAGLAAVMIAAFVIAVDTHLTGSAGPQRIAGPAGPQGPPARPAISALAPDILTQQGAAFKLTVMGSNFSHSSMVFWNGSSRSTRFLNSDTLVAQISASDIEKADEVPIQVTNPGVDGAVSNTLSFTILSPIAFVSRRALDGSDAANAIEGWNIWITRGTDAVPLTKLRTSRANSFSPVWSPDRTRIAFCSARALDGSDAVSGNGTANLWVMNADGTGAKPLTNLTEFGANSFAPAWSPDGGRIAFYSARAVDGSDAPNARLGGEPLFVPTVNLWVVNADGSGAHPLTKLTSEPHAGSLSPSWSPEGSRIAFLSGRALNGRDAENLNGAENIWIINADGSGAHPLTRLTAAGVQGSSLSAPVWSPDSTRIIFVSTRALDGRDAANTRDTSNLWIMNDDGSQVEPLTRLKASEASSLTPVWSPDGSRIAFQSARALDGRNAANTSRTSNVWVMNADGSHARPLTRLTAAGADSLTPVWSPDGSRIAFQSARALDGRNAANTNRILNLWVINADGSHARPLTRLRAKGTESVTPAWSPEAFRIAYESVGTLNRSDVVNAATGQNLPDAGPIELRYSVMQYFVPLWVCHPVSPGGAHAGDEKDAAVRAFPDIQKERETFQAIRRHLKLGRVADFSDEQKLIIYREYERLQAVVLEKWGNKYRFSVPVPTEPRIWTRPDGFMTMPDPRRIEGFRYEGTIDRGRHITLLRRTEAVLQCPP